MFKYKNGEMFCEDVPVSNIAKKAGTPFYLYSRKTFLDNYNRVKKAFGKLNPLIAFSVKANSNLSILRMLAREGGGFDIVSGGELKRVLSAGGDPQKVIYAGVGKRPHELRLALKSDILMINLESEAEAKLLSGIAEEMGVQAPVALRINPDVEAHTHEYITTGKKENKFGVSWNSAPEIIKRISELPNIDFVGLHVHVGSQILNQSPHVNGVKRILKLKKELEKININIKNINIGGGFGIAYKEREKPLNIESVAAKIVPLLENTGCRIIMEPGRFIAGPAGALVTAVTYVKHGDKKKFAIVDAGMNDLIRPSLYAAYHRIVPMKEKASKSRISIDVVGPICESADFFGKDRKLPPLEAGDLVAVCDAGAYGYVMASNYNTRPKPPEILVNGKDFYIVNKRETHEQLVSGETYPPFMK